MTPEIALQTALRARLVSSFPLGNLVPASNILDRNERPNPDPSIIIGEATVSYDGDTLKRQRSTVYLDLHIWKEEPSTAGVKAIAGAIRQALNASKLDLDGAFHCSNAKILSMRFLRDPDGETSHGVVTVEALVTEPA